METTSPCHTDDSRKGITFAGGSAVRTQSSVQELEVLYQISTSISSRLELTEVLDQIIGLVNQVTHGDSCLLYLLDDVQQELVLQASKKPHPENIGSLRLKLGEGITGWVAQEQKVVAISQNASKDSRSSFFSACRRIDIKPSCPCP